jgi:hypothetical protein
MCFRKRGKGESGDNPPSANLHRKISRRTRPERAVLYTRNYLEGGFSIFASAAAGVKRTPAQVSETLRVLGARFRAAQEKRRQTGEKTSRDDDAFPNDPRREHLRRRNAKRDEQRSN